MSEESTLDLTGRARAGDRTAFERLVARYRQRLEAYVAGQVGSDLKQRVEVEDIVQEALARAFESIDRFQWRGDDSFLAWISSIAHNRILHLARQSRRHRSIAPEMDTASPEASPSKCLMRKERFERLEKALAKLSPDHRQVILLARIEMLPVTKIAERMSRSPGAVKQLLWRALQELRSSFGETGSFRLPDLRLTDPSTRHET